MPPEAVRPIVCVGAVHQDIVSHARVPISRETSTPGSITESPGGVAANVARALARLGVDTHLVGAIGNDSAGSWLSDLLGKSGVHRHLRVCPAARTGLYLALHDPDGSLAAASVDDRILGEAPKDLFSPTLEIVVAEAGPDAIWFVEANCPEPILDDIVRRVTPAKLFADAVSRAKAPRLRAIASNLTGVFLNRGEAAALTGLASDLPTLDLADAVVDLGVDTVVLTDGANGVLVINEGSSRAYPALATAVVDVTGAGDALTAGTLAGIARGSDLDAAIGCGLRAAALALGQTGALGDALTWSAIAP